MTFDKILKLTDFSRLFSNVTFRKSSRSCGNPGISLTDLSDDDTMDALIHDIHFFSVCHTTVSVCDLPGGGSTVLYLQHHLQRSGPVL